MSSSIIGFLVLLGLSSTGFTSTDFGQNVVNSIQPKTSHWISHLSQTIAWILDMTSKAQIGFIISFVMLIGFLALVRFRSPRNMIKASMEAQGPAEFQAEFAPSGRNEAVDGNLLGNLGITQLAPFSAFPTDEEGFQRMFVEIERTGCVPVFWKRTMSPQEQETAGVKTPYERVFKHTLPIAFVMKELGLAEIQEPVKAQFITFEINSRYFSITHNKGTISACIDIYEDPRYILDTSLDLGFIGASSSMKIFEVKNPVIVLPQGQAIPAYPNDEIQRGPMAQEVIRTNLIPEFWRREITYQYESKSYKDPDGRTDVAFKHWIDATLFQEVILRRGWNQLGKRICCIVHRIEECHCGDFGSYYSGGNSGYEFILEDGTTIKGDESLTIWSSLENALERLRPKVQGGKVATMILLNIGLERINKWIQVALTKSSTSMPEFSTKQAMALNIPHKKAWIEFFGWKAWIAMMEEEAVSEEEMQIPEAPREMGYDELVRSHSLRIEYPPFKSVDWTTESIALLSQRMEEIQESVGGRLKALETIVTQGLRKNRDLHICTPLLTPAETVHGGNNVVVVGGLREGSGSFLEIPDTQDIWVGADEPTAESSAIKKFLILDGDGVLWRGILGEVGVEGIDITGVAQQSLYRSLKELQSRGVLLGVISKNSLEDVNQALDKIGIRQCFISIDAGFTDKAEVIRSVAKSHDLGLDSFVFVDDSPIERLNMQTQNPGVLTLELPDDLDRQEAFFLQISNHFPQTLPTTTDIQRQALYEARAKRRQLQATSVTREDFIRDLQIRTRLLNHEELGIKIERAAQLIARTTQFNVTLRKYTLEDLRSFMDSKDQRIFALGMADRFQEENLEGVVILKHVKDQVWAIDVFCLSCRVIGLDVELRFWEMVKEAMQIEGPVTYEAEFVPSERNRPVVGNLYRELGFTEQAENRWVTANKDNIKPIIFMLDEKDRPEYPTTQEARKKMAEDVINTGLIHVFLHSVSTSTTNMSNSEHRSEYVEYRYTIRTDLIDEGIKLNGWNQQGKRISHIKLDHYYDECNDHNIIYSDKATIYYVLEDDSEVEIIDQKNSFNFHETIHKLGYLIDQYGEYIARRCILRAIFYFGLDNFQSWFVDAVERLRRNGRIKGERYDIWRKEEIEAWEQIIEEDFIKYGHLEIVGNIFYRGQYVDRGFLTDSYKVWNSAYREFYRVKTDEGEPIRNNVDLIPMVLTAIEDIKVKKGSLSKAFCEILARGLKNVLEEKEPKTDDYNHRISWELYCKNLPKYPTTQEAREKMADEVEKEGFIHVFYKRTEESVRDNPGGQTSHCREDEGYLWRLNVALIKEEIEDYGWTKLNRRISYIEKREHCDLCGDYGFVLSERSYWILIFNDGTEINLSLISLNVDDQCVRILNVDDNEYRHATFIKETKDLGWRWSLLGPREYIASVLSLRATLGSGGRSFDAIIVDSRFAYPDLKTFLEYMNKEFRSVLVIVSVNNGADRSMAQLAGAQYIWNRFDDQRKALYEYIHALKCQKLAKDEKFIEENNCIGGCFSKLGRNDIVRWIANAIKDVNQTRASPFGKLQILLDLAFVLSVLNNKSIKFTLYEMPSHEYILRLDGTTQDIRIFLQGDHHHAVLIERKEYPVEQKIDSVKPGIWVGAEEWDPAKELEAAIRMFYFQDRVLTVSEINFSEGNRNLASECSRSFMGLGNESSPGVLMRLRIDAEMQPQALASIFERFSSAAASLILMHISKNGTISLHDQEHFPSPAGYIQTLLAQTLKAAFLIANQADPQMALYLGVQREADTFTVVLFSGNQEKPDWSSEISFELTALNPNEIKNKNGSLSVRGISITEEAIEPINTYASEEGVVLGWSLSFNVRPRRTVQEQKDGDAQDQDEQAVDEEIFAQDPFGFWDEVWKKEIEDPLEELGSLKIEGGYIRKMKRVLAWLNLFTSEGINALQPWNDSTLENDPPNEINTIQYLKRHAKLVILRDLVMDLILRLNESNYFVAFKDQLFVVLRKLRDYLDGINFELVSCGLYSNLFQYLLIANRIQTRNVLTFNDSTSAFTILGTMNPEELDPKPIFEMTDVEGDLKTDEPKINKRQYILPQALNGLPQFSLVRFGKPSSQEHDPSLIVNGYQLGAMNCKSGQSINVMLWTVVPEYYHSPAREFEVDGVTWKFIGISYDGSQAYYLQLQSGLIVGIQLILYPKESNNSFVHLMGWIRQEVQKKHEDGAFRELLSTEVAPERGRLRFEACENTIKHVLTMMEERKGEKLSKTEEGAIKVFLRIYETDTVVKDETDVALIATILEILSNRPGAPINRRSLEEPLDDEALADEMLRELERKSSIMAPNVFLCLQKVSQYLRAHGQPELQGRLDQISALKFVMQEWMRLRVENQWIKDEAEKQQRQVLQSICLYQCLGGLKLENIVEVITNDPTVLDHVEIRAGPEQGSNFLLELQYVLRILNKHSVFFELFGIPSSIEAQQIILRINNESQDIQITQNTDGSWHAVLIEQKEYPVESKIDSVEPGIWVGMKFQKGIRSRGRSKQEWIDFLLSLKAKLLPNEKASASNLADVSEGLVSRDQIFEALGAHQIKRSEVGMPENRIKAKRKENGKAGWVALLKDLVAKIPPGTAVTAKNLVLVSQGKVTLKEIYNATRYCKLSNISSMIQRTHRFEPTKREQEIIVVVERFRATHQKDPDLFEVSQMIPSLQGRKVPFESLKEWFKRNNKLPETFGIRKHYRTGADFNSYCNIEFARGKFNIPNHVSSRIKVTFGVDSQGFRLMIFTDLANPLNIYTIEARPEEFWFIHRVDQKVITAEKMKRPPVRGKRFIALGKEDVFLSFYDCLFNIPSVPGLEREEAIYLHLTKDVQLKAKLVVSGICISNGQVYIPNVFKRKGFKFEVIRFNMGVSRMNNRWVFLKIKGNDQEYFGIEVTKQGVRGIRTGNYVRIEKSKKRYRLINFYEFLQLVCSLGFVFDPGRKRNTLVPTTNIDGEEGYSKDPLGDLARDLRISKQRLIDISFTVPENIWVPFASRCGIGVEKPLVHIKERLDRFGAQYGYRNIDELRAAEGKALSILKDNRTGSEIAAADLQIAADLINPRSFLGLKENVCKSFCSYYGIGRHRFIVDSDENEVLAVRQESLVRMATRSYFLYPDRAAVIEGLRYRLESSLSNEYEFLKRENYDLWARAQVFEVPLGPWKLAQINGDTKKDSGKSSRRIKALSEQPDHYGVLGLTYLATEQEITSRAHELKVQNHPDRGGVRLTFQKIQEALNVLGNKRRRSYYHAHLLAISRMKQAQKPLKILEEYLVRYYRSIALKEQGVTAVYVDKFHLAIILGVDQSAVSILLNVINEKNRINHKEVQPYFIYPFNPFLKLTYPSFKTVHSFNAKTIVNLNCLCARLAELKLDRIIMKIVAALKKDNQTRAGPNNSILLDLAFVLGVFNNNSFKFTLFQTLSNEYILRLDGTAQDIRIFLQDDHHHAVLIERKDYPDELKIDSVEKGIWVGSKSKIRKEIRARNRKITAAIRNLIRESPEGTLTKKDIERILNLEDWQLHTYLYTDRFVKPLLGRLKRGKHNQNYRFFVHYKTTVDELVKFNCLCKRLKELGRSDVLNTIADAMNKDEHAKHGSPGVVLINLGFILSFIKGIRGICLVQVGENEYHVLSQEEMITDTRERFTPSKIKDPKDCWVGAEHGSLFSWLSRLRSPKETINYAALLFQAAKGYLDLKRESSHRAQDFYRFLNDQYERKYPRIIEQLIELHGSNEGVQIGPSLNNEAQQLLSESAQWLYMISTTRRRFVSAMAGAFAGVMSQEGGLMGKLISMPSNDRSELIEGFIHRAWKIIQTILEQDFILIDVDRAVSAQLLELEDGSDRKYVFEFIQRNVELPDSVSDAVKIFLRHHFDLVQGKWQDMIAELKGFPLHSANDPDVMMEMNLKLEYIFGEIVERPRHGPNPYTGRSDPIRELRILKPVEEIEKISRIKEAYAEHTQRIMQIVMQLTKAQSQEMARVIRGSQRDNFYEEKERREKAVEDLKNEYADFIRRIAFIEKKLWKAEGAHISASEREFYDRRERKQRFKMMEEERHESVEQFKVISELMGLISDMFTLKLKP